MPHCPRCDVIKRKLTAANIEYKENEDAVLAEKYSDMFWPLGLIQDGNTLLDFIELLAYIDKVGEKSA